MRVRTCHRVCDHDRDPERRRRPVLDPDPGPCIDVPKVSPARYQHGCVQTMSCGIEKRRGMPQSSKRFTDHDRALGLVCHVRGRHHENGHDRTLEPRGVRTSFLSTASPSSAEVEKNCFTQKKCSHGTVQASWGHGKGCSHSCTSPDRSERCQGGMTLARRSSLQKVGMLPPLSYEAISVVT